MHQKFNATRNQPRQLDADFEWQFSVGSYLGFKGAEFVERFDANSYIALSMASDLFDLGATPEELISVLGNSPCRWMMISFTSDWLFPPEESLEIVNALIRTNRPVSYCNIQSGCGHDAFLLPNEVDAYGQMIRSFLVTLAGESAERTESAGEAEHPSNIFHPSYPHRLDYDVILDLIEPGASVLDLGCGNGDLLAELAERGHQRIVGVEVNQEGVIACVGKGLNVVQADLNDGLDAFGDKQFNCIVLSRALMEIMDVERIVDDMLRVATKCIVSFPNFGYYKLRDMLYHEGRAPEAAALPYKWYNTPNIRVLTIDDFEDLCGQRGITIHQWLALDTERDVKVTEDVNRTADLAIYVISR